MQNSVVIFFVFNWNFNNLLYVEMLNMSQKSSQNLNFAWFGNKFAVICYNRAIFFVFLCLILYRLIKVGFLGIKKSEIKG